MKRFPAFVSGFDAYLEKYTKEIANADYPTTLWETEYGTVGTGFYELTFQGTQHDVDVFDPSTDVHVPSTLEVSCTTEVDLRLLVKNLKSVFRSDITDMNGFESAFLSIIDNSKAAHLMAEVFADHLQHLMKHDVQAFKEAAEYIDEAVEDEFDSYVQLRNSPKLTNPKVIKSGGGVSGRGFKIQVVVHYDVVLTENDIDLVEDDEPWHTGMDYYAAQLQRTWFPKAVK